MTDSESRERILETATSLIAHQGFAATSMNSIVAATGMSKGGVYWHFRSKMEVVRAIVERAFEQQLSHLHLILDQPGSVPDRLRILGKAVGDAALAQPDLAQAILDTYAVSSRNPELASVLRTFYAEYRKLFVALMQRGIENGEVAVASPEEAADSFIAALEGTILLGIFQERQSQGKITKKKIQATIDLFLRAVAVSKENL